MQIPENRCFSETGQPQVFPLLGGPAVGGYGGLCGLCGLWGAVWTMGGGGGLCEGLRGAVWVVWTVGGCVDCEGLWGAVGGCEGLCGLWGDVGGCVGLGLALGGPHRSPRAHWPGSWAAGQQCVLCRALTRVGQALPVTVGRGRATHTPVNSGSAQPPGSSHTGLRPPHRRPGAAYGRGLCCGVHRPYTPRLRGSEPRTVGAM